MKYVAVVAALMFSTGAAFAQTCAAPTPIGSNETVNGTTCGGEIGINLAGSIFGHPSVVFSFTADNASGQITLTGTDREWAIAPSCTEAPVAIGNANDAIHLPPDLSDALTNGQSYVLIVSTDSGIPVANPPVCGPFGLTTPTLPVELQTFSVD